MREGLVALAVLLGLLAGAAVAQEAAPGPERQRELMHLLRHDCGACHGLTLGGGLGPALLPERLAGRREAELVATILEGVPDTPMPPWAGELEPAEAAWLVRRLQQGVGDAR